MNNKNTKLIILAAGKGKQIKNKVVPGPLIDINNKSILEHQCSILRKAGIKKISLVINNDSNLWSNKNISIAKKFVDEIIVNNEYSKTKSGNSFNLGLQSIDNTVKRLVFIDGDLVFNPEVINAIFDYDSKKSSVLVTQRKDSSETGVIYSNVMKEGYMLKDIGQNVLSDLVYSGIINFSEKGISYLQDICKDGKYNKLNVTDVFRDFIRKENLFCILDNKQNTDDDSSFIDIKDLAGGSYAKTYKIHTKDGALIRKQILSPGTEKLIDECNWINSLSKNAKKHFPKIISYYFPKTVPHIDIKYYNMDTIRTQVLNGKLSSNKSVSALLEVFNFLFKNIYNSNVSKPKKDFVMDTHIRRTYGRLNEVRATNKIFSKIINSKSIYINNVKYNNIIFLLKKISKDRKFLEKMTPPKVNSIHGDLHFDNILYKNKKDYVLIDPRGCETGDIAYDVGKVFHSCHGHYDLIHTGKFILKSDKENKFTFKIKHAKIRTYNSIFIKIEKEIKKFSKKHKDPNLFSRALFAEAMHFASVLPFHIKNDNKETIPLALYLMGVILLNNIYHYESNNIYNINTLEDYKNTLRCIKSKY